MITDNKIEGVVLKWIWVVVKVCNNINPFMRKHINADCFAKFIQAAAKVKDANIIIIFFRSNGSVVGQLNKIGSQTISFSKNISINFGCGKNIAELF